jgi:hypothetical protein
MAPVLEAPVKEAEVEVLTPEEELRLLEEQALRLGMTPEELARIRAIGRCPAQVRTRVTMLRRWLSSHGGLALICSCLEGYRGLGGLGKNHLLTQFDSMA